LIGQLTGLNIDRSLYSARQDIAMLKGLAIGGGLEVVTSLFAGPVVGTWIVYSTITANFAASLPIPE
jgi:hypothetical protein